ncbi:MAG: DUF6569 family protein [Desulfatitalea sp.]
MQSNRTLFFSLILIAATALPGNTGAEQNQPRVKTQLNDDYQLSGPYRCENLSVFLIHGNDKVSGKKFLSLAEALDKRLVTIHETGNVNRLTAQNHSAESYIFIQSGDIVKGGRQDRTLGQDVLLPPKSGKIALDSFCVEQGRWSQRGKETAATFSSSSKHLSSKELKLAAKRAKSQTEVWKAVAAEQERLSQTVGQSVRNDASATSLQLSLESNAIEEKSRKYQQMLLPIGQGEKDAVGFAYAIDGQFTTAEVYGSSALFQMLWPKLIEAATCESIALYKPQPVAPPTDHAVIKTYILEALSSPRIQEASDKYTQRKTSDSKESHAFETKDEKDQLIHLNVIKK